MILFLYFYPTGGKNKDEPRKDWHWPADVISELKEETHVCVYLKRQAL